MALESLRCWDDTPQGESASFNIPVIVLGGFVQNQAAKFFHLDI